MEGFEVYSESAIPFLEIQDNPETGEVDFVLNPQAEEYLKQMTSKKVAVLTIAGPQRSGKSFLANRFLKKMTGFAIGPTTNPCTKGIWLWGKPISLNNEIDLLIMDTEGLNSTQRDQTIDMKIFSIAILLSSYFMYNSFGHIDETALENLSLVVHLSEHISISSQGSNENDYAKYFPYFHWILRDFSLDLKGRSSNQYFEYALQTIQGNDPEKQKKNNIRSKIRNYFKARECTCLVRPLNEESKLANIENQRWDELRPEFRENVEILVNNVMASMRPKIIQGKALTGEMILNLTKAYLQAMNTGGVPQILTSMERVISSEMKRIFDSLVKEYMAMIEEAFNEKTLPIPEDELFKKHKEIVTFITKKLSTNGEIIGHKEVALIQQKLNVGFEKNLKSKLDLNEEKIGLHSSKTISKFATQIKIPHAADLEEGFPQLKMKLINPFRDSFFQFYEGFKNDVKGSNKKFAIFSEMIPKMIFDYYDKVVEVCEQLKDEEVDDVKAKLAQAREGEEALRRILADNQGLLDQLKQEKSDIRASYEEMKAELKEVNEKTDAEKGKLEHKLKEMTVLYETAKVKIDSLYSQLEPGKNQHNFNKEEELLNLRGEVEVLEDKNKLLQRDIERFKQTISDLQDELDEAYANKGDGKENSAKNSKRSSPNKHKSPLKDEEEDGDYERPPQVEALIQEIVLLKDRINELEGRKGESNLDDEETKDSRDIKRFEDEVEIELLDESSIAEEQLLALCPNEELKEKVRVIMTNYSRQKLLFQKKLKVIFRENNRLKAESIDLNEKFKDVKKKDEQIENLKKEIKNLNSALNDQINGRKAEGVLEMQLAELKSERLRMEGEKDNLFYFFKEAIMKIKKKKGNHYDHAWNTLSEQDKGVLMDIFNELGIKM